MRKTLINIIVISIIILFAIGVFYKKGKKDNLKKITVSEVAHSVFYAPMYVADALGYFEEEGLDVDIVLTSGADAVAASVMSGASEIGFCGSEQSIYIYNGGEKDYLVNFAGLTKRDGSFIVGRVDKDFDIMDLKGSHIIAGREGGMPAMTLAYTLKEQGISLDELEFDTSIAFAAMGGAFISGTGDYVALFEPTARFVPIFAAESFTNLIIYGKKNNVFRSIKAGLDALPAATDGCGTVCPDKRSDSERPCAGCPDT